MSVLKKYSLKVNAMYDIPISAKQCVTLMCSNDRVCIGIEIFLILTTSCKVGTHCFDYIIAADKN